MWRQTVLADRTRGNRYKLEIIKFQIDTKKIFSTIRVGQLLEQAAHQGAPRSTRCHVDIMGKKSIVALSSNQISFISPTYLFI